MPHEASAGQRASSRITAAAKGDGRAGGSAPFRSRRTSVVTLLFGSVRKSSLLRTDRFGFAQQGVQREFSPSLLGRHPATTGRSGARQCAHPLRGGSRTSRQGRA